MNGKLVWFAFSMLAAGILPADAQTNHLWPKLSLAGGSYWISTDDEIRIDGSAGARGTDVSLDADFGLPETESLASFELDWGFAKKHSLGFRYYAYDREGSRTASGIFEVGEVDFPVGARLESTFDNTSIEAVYNYWFVRHDGLGFAGSLGLVYLSLDASVTGTAVFGNAGATETRQVSESSDLPVPMIGLAVKGSPWHRLVLFADARYLPSVSVGDIDGEAASYSLGADFYLFGGFALGASYDGSFYGIDVDQSDWHGAVDLTIEGWKGYARVSF